MHEKFPNNNLAELVRLLDMTKRLVTSPSTHVVRAGMLKTEEKGSQDLLAPIAAKIDRPGGRHDNDFADISDIAILPTTEEVNRVYNDYLPSTNFKHSHVLKDPLQRYVDSLFRLIRHDTMGPIIKILRALYKSDNKMVDELYNPELNMDIYHGCVVHDLHLGAGLKAVLSFDTPRVISHRSIEGQQKWWENCGLLEEGKLVRQRKVKERDERIAPYANLLVFKGKSPRITVDLVAVERSSMNPTYRFDGISLTTLETQTGLNKGQCQGLVAALTREYALIQGPPGTGKSHLAVQLVRVLLAAKKQAKLGPIIISTQTITESCLKSWLGDVRPPSNKSLEQSLEQLSTRAEKNIYDLSSAERWALAGHWTETLLERKADATFEAATKLERHYKERGDVRDAISQRVLAQAHVIGITTSAAARNTKLLQSVSPKVMICEEAAEVVEPHLISSTIPGIEHLIQIGDHKQLRPHINDCELGVEKDSEKKWLLDRSQFERRADGEPGLSPAPVVQLNVQRRMRPEISQLIHSVYPKLQDHSSIQDYPDVSGMRHNVFWLDHSYREARSGEGPHGTSYSNPWEAKMATALVRHLVRQGEYKPEDIALLTPYNGQLWLLTRSLSNEFEMSIGSKDPQQSGQKRQCEGSQDSHKVPTKKKLLTEALRLATVDNFQGEEAKVVIISLVRSNQRQKIGFLKTANRINVLLSRARHGMYLIGDANTYRQVPMWNNVYYKLSDAAAVGTKLELRCPRHPDAIALCSEPGHFNIMSPAGGCELPCTWDLEPCGHKCKAKCHSKLMHKAMSCNAPCSRLRETCDHNLKKTAQVDLLEFRPFSEINLDENPIIVLGCGHFFTGETLDGLIGPGEACLKAKKGEFVGWKEVSSCFATNVPICPYCEQPIRQHDTKRYGRLVKQAVMDENYRRFLIQNQGELDQLERKLQDLESNLTTTRPSFLKNISPITSVTTWAQKRYADLADLRDMANAFEQSMGQKARPTATPVSAIESSQVQATGSSSPGDVQTEALGSSQHVPRQQVTLRARLIYTEAQELHLRDFFALSPVSDNASGYTSMQNWLKSQSLPTLPDFLNNCADMVKQANDSNLTRIAIAGTLSFAKIARILHYYRDTKNVQSSETCMFDAVVAEEQTKHACELLDAALVQCSKFSDGEKLKQKFQECVELFYPRHEKMTRGELASITSAMFAVGDCGMPTEVARCPECEAPVGGTSHRPLDGVTRAEEIETADTITEDAPEMEHGGEVDISIAEEEAMGRAVAEVDEQLEVAVPEDEARHETVSDTAHDTTNDTATETAEDPTGAPNTE
ncbi:hypothetical protein IL306_002205 [Fusarium sp. DS 682]|nr:hypothetical protein IL306_002205 [Fusarium sp. DS 682]